MKHVLLCMSVIGLLLTGSAYANENGGVYNVTKAKLSGSVDGRGIKVAATGTPGTLIHTAVAGTAAGTFDEIWLYAKNNSGAAHWFTIEFGGTTAPDDRIDIFTSGTSINMLVIPGYILQNGRTVRAFSATGANAIVIYGFVNEIRP